MGIPTTQFSRSCTEMRRNEPAFFGTVWSMELNTPTIAAVREQASDRFRPQGMVSGLSRKSTSHHRRVRVDGHRDVDLHALFGRARDRIMGAGVACCTSRKRPQRRPPSGIRSSRKNLGREGFELVPADILAQPDQLPSRRCGQPRPSPDSRPTTGQAPGCAAGTCARCPRCSRSPSEPSQPGRSARLLRTTSRRARVIGRRDRVADIRLMGFRFDGEPMAAATSSITGTRMVWSAGCEQP